MSDSYETPSRTSADAAADVEALRAALRGRPDDATLHIELANALLDCGDGQGAHDTLLQACRLAPRSARAWHNLGKLYRDGAHIKQALYSLARARALMPDDPEILLDQADVLRMCGRSADSAAALRRAIDLAPRDMRSWHALANLKTEPFTDDETARLESLLHESEPTTPLTIDQLVLGRFALARALEVAGRHEPSFALYVQANQLKRQQVHWDAQALSKQVDACIASFARVSGEIDDNDFGHEVIFVVSLPRSGSTLVEQILASHPSIEGAGELTDLGDVIKEESRRRNEEFPDWSATVTASDWRHLGQRYLDRTRRWQSRPRFVDKSLNNWRMVGAVRSMLPGAHIVECRRDPIETCWSCFTQLFRRASHFTYDFGDIAAFWHDYDRLMRFWHQRYPGSIYTLEHETLLAEPEAEIRRLLDYCALPFDPSCLRFNETRRQVRTESGSQVRQSLRADTSRTKAYGTLLDPLRRALAKNIHAG